MGCSIRSVDIYLSLDKVKRKEYIENIENENVLNLERYACEVIDLIIDPDSPYNNIKNNIKNLNLGFLVVVDENGNEWTKTPEGELIFRGNKDEDPLREELRDFLSKTGISEDRNMKLEKIKEFWMTAENSLISKMKPNQEIEHFRIMLCQGGAQKFVYDHYNQKQIQLPDIGVDGYNSLINGLKYSHDNTLMQVTCAYILDFWHNHRELHQHLRQCKCCGKFWIEANTRRKYCCKKCEDRFNQASRQAVRESLRKQRKTLSQDEEKIERNKIVKWLCKTGGYTPKKAEEILNNEKHRKSTNVKSLANFKRTYGEKSGLI
jgi:hypothetical protein